MNFRNYEFYFRFSSIIKVAKKECFGDNKMFLKFLAAIKEPIGDYIAISKVISS